MNREEIKKLVLQVAEDAARKGPGWAQESVVLRELGDKLSQRNGQSDLRMQQSVLEVWHDLFAEKILAWGYDLDNPGSPFFHVRPQVDK